MISLLKIELKKILTYRTFWVLTGLYLLSLVIVLGSLQAFLDKVVNNSDIPENIEIPTISLYIFPDIWHNLSYIASSRFSFKVILAIIVIILITNEYSFRTIRQNIISGLSRTEFLLGKLEIIILLCFTSTIILFFTGLGLGISHTKELTFNLLTSKMEFLAAYFIELLVYLSFAMFIAILLRKAGLAIGLLLLYTILEPIIKLSLPGSLGKYLPLEAMNNLIHLPNTKLMKLMGVKFQENIAVLNVTIAIIYGIVFIFLSWILIKHRDL
jgi:ABC-type transport system involved in multi-copper enzyme maturation permease subunit